MTTREKKPDQSIVGREAVIAAVLASAAHLYAEKGPAATSIREVAAHSGVNHGLVFRHFGAKEQLVTATLNHLGERVAELMATQAPRADLDAALTLHSTVMARALLEGFAIDDVQTKFPGIELFLDAIRPEHPSENSARIAAANAVALQLGWRLFGPFLRASAGLQNVPDERLRSAVDAEIARVVISQHPDEEN